MKTDLKEAAFWYRNQSGVRGRHALQIRANLRHGSAGRTQDAKDQDERQAVHDESQAADFARWADAIEQAANNLEP